MKAVIRVVGLALAAVLLATALAILSVYIERTGPELAAYGNLCGASTNEPCYELALKGGYPFAYLFDSPGVSVEHKLSFIEDKFIPSWFLANCLAYLFILCCAYVFYKRKQGQQMQKCH